MTNQNEYYIIVVIAGIVGVCKMWDRTKMSFGFLIPTSRLIIIYKLNYARMWFHYVIGKRAALPLVAYIYIASVIAWNYEFWSNETWMESTCDKRHECVSRMAQTTLHCWNNWNSKCVAETRRRITLSIFHYSFENIVVVSTSASHGTERPPQIVRITKFVYMNRIDGNLSPCNGHADSKDEWNMPESFSLLFVCHNFGEYCDVRWLHVVMMTPKVMKIFVKVSN